MAPVTKKCFCSVFLWKFSGAGQIASHRFAVLLANLVISPPQCGWNGQGNEWTLIQTKPLNSPIMVKWCGKNTKPASCTLTLPIRFGGSCWQWWKSLGETKNPSQPISTHLNTSNVFKPTTWSNPTNGSSKDSTVLGHWATFRNACKKWPRSFDNGIHHSAWVSWHIQSDNHWIEIWKWFNWKCGRVQRSWDPALHASEFSKCRMNPSVAFDSWYLRHHQLIWLQQMITTP